MKVNKILKAPFPRPERSRKNIIWIFLLGVCCSLFILVYNPFGIADQRNDLFASLIIFSLGILFSISIVFMEFVIPRIFPKPFRYWTFEKAIVWYTHLAVFVGTVNFLYKSYLESFRSFTFEEFLFVLLRTSVISLTVAFIVVGLLQFFNRNKLSTITSGVNFKIKSTDGKIFQINLNTILFISSDDNYVDIHLMENNDRRKLIVRSSLKNIESQLVNPISPIIRCHRQYLVNKNKFKLENTTSRNMTLHCVETGDQIPVSRNHEKSVRSQMSINH
jgi:hypothetical protein